MYCIVTRQNADGSWDQVGMASRIPCSTLVDARRTARIWLDEGHAVRIEGWYPSRFANPGAEPDYVSVERPWVSTVVAN
jgi:hypothetical protein